MAWVDKEIYFEDPFQNYSKSENLKKALDFSVSLRQPIYHILTHVSLMNFSIYFGQGNNNIQTEKRINTICQCSLGPENSNLSTTTCSNCLKMGEILKKSKILFGLFFASTVSILGIIIIYQKHTFNKKMISFNSTKVSPAPEYTNIKTVRKTCIKLTDSINDDTELTILAGLARFEDNYMFTKKGITLGNLATEFQTNVKYLSVIIKEHKAENFKSYINNLRINYIIDKMENDPSFKKYKLSYLAQIAGFPTASSFTKTFKDIIGETPSLYFLEKEKDKETNPRYTGV